MEEHGKHIKIQIYGVDFEKLTDTALTESFLVDAVHAVGMRELDEPWVYDIRKELEAQGVEPCPEEPEGVTGIIVLSTSHCAIHTWPHRGYAVIDIFSCSDFDTDKAMLIVERYYDPVHAKPHDLSHSLVLPPLTDDT